MSGVGAVFVDRDGVINQLVPDPIAGRPESPLSVGDVRLVDGAAEALARLQGTGWTIVGVSNQPAAAKGTITLALLHEIQERVVALVAARAGVRFDDFCLCLHHPEATVAELRGPCDCRKPAPGMLVAAAADLSIDLSRSFMIGDTDADVAAGHAVGCVTILVEAPGSAHKRSAAARADHVVGDLAGAADLILESRGID